MDPAFITAEDWNDLFAVVHFFWAIPLFAIGFAFNLLLAKAVIPSLVSTHQLSPERARLLQPALYAVSFVSLALLVWVFFNIVTRAGILHEVYARWWI